MEKSISNANSDIKNMSFEEAIKELDNIVQKLELGSVELAQSIAIYERGEALKKHCAHLLRQAELKIEKIKLDQEGNFAGTEKLEESQNSYI